jgi:hypothetical protein
MRNKSFSLSRQSTKEAGNWKLKKLLSFRKCYADSIAINLFIEIKGKNENTKRKKEHMKKYFKLQ